MPYCFSRSFVKFQGNTWGKNHWFWPKLEVSGLWLQFGFSDGYGMMHEAWSSIENVPCCFSKSSVKFQGHTGQKITIFDPNLEFPDCNSSLNSPMALKWCTKLNIVYKRCPIIYKGDPRISRSHGTKKIGNFHPNWALPDCNSSLNSPMYLKWCINLDVV